MPAAQRDFWMKFEPAQWLADTRPLSPAAKGAWIDTICQMVHSVTRGSLRLPLAGWARLWSMTCEQAKAVVEELDTMRVADVIRDSNGNVTLLCRRLVREAHERHQIKERVARHRGKSGLTSGGDASVDATRQTLRAHGSNGDVTQKKRRSNAVELELELDNNTTPLTPLPGGGVPVPEGLRSQEFIAAWLERLAERKRRRRPITPEMAALQLKRLDSWGLPAALEAVRQSTEFGWAGLFDPRKKRGRRQAGNGPPMR